MLLKKENALYVFTSIIPNGVMDFQGDNPPTEDIITIYTKYNNQNSFEIHHKEIPLTEVSLLSNYLSTCPEFIGDVDFPDEGYIIPPVSWNVIIRVDNPDVKEDLLAGVYNGVSLNNRIEEECQGDLKGIVKYSDVESGECIIPKYISFVEEGANLVPLLVMDYEAFKKRFKDLVEEDNMEKNDAESKLSRILEVLGINREEPKILKSKCPSAVPKIQKSAEVLDEEDSLENIRDKLRIAVDAKLREFKSIKEEDYVDYWFCHTFSDAVIVEYYPEDEYLKMDYSKNDDGNYTVGEPKKVKLQYVEVDSSNDETDESTDESSESSSEEGVPKIQKSIDSVTENSDDVNDKIDSLTNDVAEIKTMLTSDDDDEEEEEEEESEVDEEEGDESTDETGNNEPKILKSKKVVASESGTPKPKSTYYDMAGRDPNTGKRLRN